MAEHTAHNRLVECSSHSVPIGLESRDNMAIIVIAIIVAWIVFSTIITVCALMNSSRLSREDEARKEIERRSRHKRFR